VRDILGAYFLVNQTSNNPIGLSYAMCHL
jgi:hypothetical protein